MCIVMMEDFVEGRGEEMGKRGRRGKDGTRGKMGRGKDGVKTGEDRYAILNGGQG